MELAGRTAFVTGAASGIGRATALLLAREGARVAIADVDEAGLLETADLLAHAGGRPLPLPLDVTDRAAVEGAVQHTIDRFGKLDAAANIAGLLGATAPLDELDLDGFRRVMEVNFWGTLHCLRAEIAAMLAGGGGAIVNLASGAGLVGWPGASAYVSSKHAVVGLTKTAGIDYAARGIRINALCPGYVRTGMTTPLFEPEGAETQAAASQPIGRIAAPEEIAEAVLWLLSDRASFIVAAAIPIDGGYTAQ